MMKKWVSVLLSVLLFPVLSWSQAPAASHIWERAAFGNIPGFQFISLNGTSSAITTTFEPFWPEATTYTVLTTAMSSPYCASASTNDTSAGTGARTIRVKGITSAFAAFSENLSLNGQTSVSLTNTTAQFINSVEVLTVGSGGSNAGIIRCGTGTNTSGVPAVVHAHIPIGYDLTASASYAVPANYSLICRNWTISARHTTASHAADVVIDTYTNNGPIKRKHLPAIQVSGTTGVVYPGMITFPEKTIIVPQIQSAAGVGPVYLQSECLLISNTWAATSQEVF